MSFSPFGDSKALLALLSIGATIVILRRWTRQSVAPLPPGPSMLRLLQDLRSTPPDKVWLALDQWAREFGDITYANMLGEPMVFVNSAKKAAEILDQKSAISSDRRKFMMTGELMGWKDALMFLGYGQRFRTQRRLIHEVIGTPAAISKFHPMLETEVHRLLNKLLSSPTDLVNHIRDASGAAILRLTYGYEVVPNGNDPLVELANTTMDQFSKSTSPTRFLVDSFPFLMHVPEWFPGAGFKTIAREWGQNVAMMANKPYQFVKDGMRAGNVPTSFVAQNLERMETDGRNVPEEDIKWSALALYAGGADTTVATTHAFFLAMVLYPECAKLAQKELDEVVGTDRLPTFEDLDNLPYVRAIAREIQRWHTTSPMSLPHLTTEDDVHDGYLIPKGTTVVGLIYHMAHDERVYKDPFVFKPERFLGPHPEPDPWNITFGFGRRVCPGRLFADSSVFITIAMTLAVFDIGKAYRDGKEIEVTHELLPGTIVHCKPFECSIKPRSKKAERLILQAVDL